MLKPYKTRQACIQHRDEEAAARSVSSLFRRGVTQKDAGPGSLHRTVRLLLLCRTRTERQLVGLHDYQGLSLAVAGDRLGVGERRACDLWASLVHRLRQAEDRHRRDEILARNNWGG